MEIAIGGGLALSLVLLGIVGIARALLDQWVEYVHGTDDTSVHPLHNGPHGETGEES